jgi:hypothetical protein
LTIKGWEELRESLSAISRTYRRKTIKNGDKEKRKKRGNRKEGRKDKQSDGKTRIINDSIIKLTFFSFISRFYPSVVFRKCSTFFFFVYLIRIFSLIQRILNYEKRQYDFRNEFFNNDVVISTNDVVRGILKGTVISTLKCKKRIEAEFVFVSMWIFKQRSITKEDFKATS